MEIELKIRCKRCNADLKVDIRNDEILVEPCNPCILDDVASSFCVKCPHCEECDRPETINVSMAITGINTLVITTDGG